MIPSPVYLHALQCGYSDAVATAKAQDFQNFRLLSSIFIAKVHERLNSYITESGNEQQVCFSNRIKNPEFNNRSEFLFDIHVCEKGYLTSSIAKGKIAYIKKSDCVIESEFAENLRDSVADFSKLVCSNSSKKIMVLPYSMTGNEESNYLRPLTPLAESVQGELYVMFIPHPRKWKTLKGSIEELATYKCERGEWMLYQ